MGKVSVKEMNELLEGVIEAVKAGKKVRDIVKDGMDASDLPKAFELVKEQASKLEVYSAAAKDISKIKDEIKDLDKEELLVLIMRVVSAVEEIEKI